MANGKNQIPPTPVRLPADLRLWLKHQAVDNNRSLNQEIAHRLAQSRQLDVENDPKTGA